MQSEHFGIENVGVMRVPMSVVPKKGLSVFLKHNFLPPMREALVYTLAKENIVPHEKLRTELELALIDVRWINT